VGFYFLCTLFCTPDNERTLENKKDIAGMMIFFAQNFPLILCFHFGVNIYEKIGIA